MGFQDALVMGVQDALVMGVQDALGVNIVEHAAVGSSMGAEKGCCALDYGTIDSLDRSKEVLSLIAVSVTMDFLAVASHPSILHFPQLLLHKL
ncbi:unnamed protein product [Dibothriocephalus latus]|uniref:Uncharacterized protein n=1 Tax=Dibothriocephalus latus TaxID=60516 RepID=A0A3P6RTB0_DIBLA|nr:unnamed protein product [Dibothriocephalus latus]